MAKLEPIEVEVRVKLVYEGMSVMAAANEVKWAQQRVERGWSTRDSWSLTHFMLSWLPDILKEYYNPADPKTDRALDKMIEGFTIYRDKIDEWYNITPEEQKKIDKAKKLFMKHFDSLWN